MLPEADTILSTAWAISLKVSIVLALAGAIAMMLRRSQASWRHLVWSLAVGSALLLPVLTLALPDFGVPALSGILPAKKIETQAVQTNPAAATQATDEAGGTSALDHSSVAREAGGVPAAAAASPGEGDSPAAGKYLPSSLSSLPREGTRGPAWALGILALWLSGIAAVLAVLLAGVVGTRRMARHSRQVREGRLFRAAAEAANTVGLSRPLRLLVSDQSAMPMTWGVLQPTVVLPAEAETWPGERLRVVLLHELAHIRRHDWLTQFVARLACAVHWFNPLIWLAVSRLQHERELACDDYVLRTGSRPSDYASHLLGIARSLRARSLALQAGVAMARPSGFSQRLRAVLEAGRRRAELGRRQVFATWLGAAVLVLPLAAVSAGAPEPLAATKVDTPTADVPALQLSYGYTETDGQLEVSSSLPDRGAARVDVWGSDAVDAQQGCDWMQRRQGRNFSSSTSIDDHRVRARVKRDDCELEINIEGELRVNDEETDIVSLERGGRFELEERADGERFRLVITADGSGGLERRWYVNGDQRPYDQEARSWLAEMLPTMYRVTGIDAENRARRILRSRGTEGLLQEIALVPGDHAASKYYGVLLTQPDLSRDDYVRMLRQASAEISSDHSLGRLLTMIAESDAIDDDAVRLAYVEASASISSDHEKGKVLETILTRRDLSQEVTGEMLRQAGSISSDHEAGKLLRAYLEHYSLPEALIPEFFSVVDEISSDHEKGRVFKAVLEKGASSQEVLDRILTSARDISSDHELGELLRRTAELYPMDRAIPDSYMDAARSIGSDHELGRVLSQLIRRGTLESAAQMDVLETSRSIGSDHELSRVLVEFQDHYKLSDRTRDAYFNTVGAIGSDHSHAQVLKKLLDRPDLSEEDLAALLGSALRIGSDSTLSRVLVKAADSGRIEGDLRDAYVRVAESISSESQRSRALAALAR